MEAETISEFSRKKFASDSRRTSSARHRRLLGLAGFRPETSVDIVAEKLPRPGAEDFFALDFRGAV
jgi:hypothetical protein